MLGLGALLTLALLRLVRLDQRDRDRNRRIMQSMETLLLQAIPGNVRGNIGLPHGQPRARWYRRLISGDGIVVSVMVVFLAIDAGLATYLLLSPSFSWAVELLPRS